MPVDIDAVQDLASRKGLRVIYAAAQAHLATNKGKGIGAFGDACTYSFYATKNLATGEGGMVTTNDKDIADRIAAVSSGVHSKPPGSFFASNRTLCFGLES